MTPEELKNRTEKFANRVVKLFQNLPKTVEAQVIGKQLLRSATSVAANYRAVCRARSKQEFYSKLSIVVEEADESALWLELIAENKILPENQINNLYNEAIELLKIFAVSRKTIRNT